MKSNEFIELSICLTDIDKTAITTASNGKKYLNVQVSVSTERKFEKNASMTVYNKETKARAYIGNGKLKAWVDKKPIDIEVLPETANENTTARPEVVQPADYILTPLANADGDPLPF
jgi:hypothetical protein